MRSMSCLARNLETISCPNVNETPLSFSPQPVTSLSGSDHRRSHKRPGWTEGLIEGYWFVKGKRERERGRKERRDGEGKIGRQRDVMSGGGGEGEGGGGGKREREEGGW